MKNNYLDIMQESLKQKMQVLDEIILYNQKQEEMLKAETASLEEFDAYVDKKDVLIQKLLKLDDGFESMYEHVKEELQGKQELYREQITAMQKMIAQITDKSVNIQAQEARNKALVEQYVAKQKQNLQVNRVNSRKAYDYYQTLSRANTPHSQIMDQKQ